MLLLSLFIVQLLVVIKCDNPVLWPSLWYCIL